ncbi:hypothetical protein [Acetobacterium bakii]|uniref:Uncharacterized protein n=1 Tax=Acetobacterium bakii TaxID=52689 RepID=A0A0L6U485_9FIRM|nr:hypothetical protein [Acetobacterium bakii]KNZ42610.1 hypothetical protein AKG39_05510 [Acetobacterium bakii]
MKKHSKGILIAIAFIALSAIMYTLHFFIFGDAHHIFIYLLGDLAFLPVDVLLVALIFHKVIDDRDKQEKLKKINMVLSVFFSEIGVDLMKLFAQNDKNLVKLKPALLIRPTWNSKDYKNSIRIIKNSDYNLDLSEHSLTDIKEFLSSNRDFLLKILENPILLEHESFTDLILALFHVEQELSSRKDVSQLNANDRAHLVLDIERVYKLLFYEWLLYMNHLRKTYPFLYSYAVRTNPFDPDADIEVK